MGKPRGTTITNDVVCAAQVLYDLHMGGVSDKFIICLSLWLVP